MKKLSTLLLIAVCAANLFAVRPGDKAAAFGNVKWIRGQGFDVAEAVRLPKGKSKHLRMAVFLLCRASASEETVRMLDSLQAKNPDLQIAILTPDPVADVQELLKDMPASGAAFGIDVERKTTPAYMAGNLLFPMAFLIDEKGMVVWCGEAVDAPEAVEKFFTSGLDSSTQREIASGIDNLQMLIRGGSEREMSHCVNDILSLEPGHPGALRIRVFVLEQSNRFHEAWALLLQEIDKSPKLTRLYVSAFDLIRRHKELDDKLPLLMEKFSLGVTKNEHLNAMAWGLLNSFDFNITALEYAKKFHAQASAQLKDSAPLEMTAALLNYRLGNLDKAISHQDQASEILEKSGDASGAADSRKRAEFFRNTKKLSGIAD